MKRRIKNDIEMFDVDAQLDAAFGCILYRSDY